MIIKNSNKLDILIKIKKMQILTVKLRRLKRNQEILIYTDYQMDYQKMRERNGYIKRRYKVNETKKTQTVNQFVTENYK